MKKTIANILYLLASAFAVVGLITLIPAALLIALAIGSSTVGDRLTSGVWNDF